MTTQTKLKIIPGRGLTGKDIKNRLRNRTLQGQTFGDDAYTLDENMVQFTKMSKVEQIAAAKANSQEVRKIQHQLEEVNNKQKQKQHEQDIERKVKERMQQITKEQQANNNQNNNK